MRSRKTLHHSSEQKKNVILVESSAGIIPLINSCDVFVTFFSTTALQALYAGKPVITIDVPGSGGGRLFPDSQATWVARTAEELMKYVTNLLSPQCEDYLKTKEEARNRFLDDMVFRTDGEATKRVVEFVADLLGPKQTDL